MEHRHRERQALLLSAGQRPDQRLALVLQIHAAQDVAWRERLRVERAIQPQRLENGELGNERRRLQLHAQPRAQLRGRAGGIQAEHRDGAGRGHAQPFENLDERGFAGAVRTEQADQLPGAGNGEIDPAERMDGAVGLAQAVNVDGHHAAIVAPRDRRRQ